MKIEENIKIKNLLKGLFENQEFETTFQDNVTSWDDEEDVYEEYSFKYYMEVGKVLGEGTKTVASINVIITDILKDGEDFYYDWKEHDYNENVWYILKLDSTIYEEKMQDIPISIYPTFYSQEEYDILPSDQKNL
jgi:hypothetical protein